MPKPHNQNCSVSRGRTSQLNNFSSPIPNYDHATHSNPNSQYNPGFSYAQAAQANQRQGPFTGQHSNNNNFFRNTYNRSQSRGPNKNNVAFNQNANVNQQKTSNNKGKETNRNPTPSSSTGPSTNSSNFISLDAGFKITTNSRLDKIEMMMLQFQQHITNLSNVVTQMQTHLAAQQQITDKRWTLFRKINTRSFIPSP